MKTPAELYKESLVHWSEPLPATCLAPNDWHELVDLFVADNPSADVGLQLASCIEDQGLTASHFEDGGEVLFILAWNSLAQEGDVARIRRFASLHQRDIRKFINKDKTLTSRALSIAQNLDQGDTQ